MPTFASPQTAQPDMQPQQTASIGTSGLESGILPVCYWPTSLLTDTWISNHARVIDVIRDSVLLFAESLSLLTDDQFTIHGFPSRKHDLIRFHNIKTFDENYTGATRGRINVIKPGY